MPLSVMFVGTLSISQVKNGIKISVLRLPKILLSAVLDAKPNLF